MKKLLLLVSLALVTCAVIAQTVLPNGVSFRKQPHSYTPINAPQGSSRAAQEIRLDYFGNEFNEAPGTGSQAFYLSWAVNNAFDVRCTPTVDTTDFSSLKWAGVRFDSLFDVGSGTVYDIATSSIVVDTVYVTLAEHQNNSGLNDTLVVRIMEVNAASVPTVNRGLTYQTGTNNEVISNNVLWSDTLIFNVSLTSTIGTLTFPVNGGTAGGLNIPNPENGFIVMMDYFGPKIDTFFIADANNFACGGSSLPVSSFVPRNSLSYINYNFVSGGNCTDLSGVDDLVAGSGAPCNVFYRQNMGIAASVRVDQLSTGCPGPPTGTAGFRPDSNNVPCVVRNIAYQENVEFEVPSTVGGLITINSFVVDSINNLPCGLTYSLDRPNGTYSAGEVGCITFSGTTSDPVGQYKLGFYVTMSIQGFPTPVSGELSALGGQLGFPIYSQYLRVKSTVGASCPALGPTSNNLQACASSLPLSVTATASPATICSGNSTTLTASASGGSSFYVYLWQPGNLTGPTVTVSPSSTTTYTVIVNDGANSANETVTVNVQNCSSQCPAPVTGTPGFTPDTNSLPCAVQSVFYQENVSFELPGTLATFNLDSVRVDSVTNLPCGITYTLDKPSATYNGGTTGCVTYSGTTTDPTGEYKLGIYGTFFVSGIPIPVSGEFSALGAQFGLSGFSQYIRVKATAGAACPNIGSSVSRQSSGVVCPGGAPLTVTASASPSTVCLGSNAVLTATASGGAGLYSYSWQPGNLSGQTVVVSPGTTTTYTVTVVDLSGIATDTTQVIVTTSTTPSVSISNNQSTLCSGQNFVFTANASNAGSNPSYLWFSNGMNTGITTQTYSVTNGVAGAIYMVQVTSSDPCASPVSTTASVTIVNCGAPLSATASASPSTICAGSSTTLTAAGAGGTGSYTYTWQPGNLSGSSVVVSPTSTTTYTVTVNDGSNTATATAAVSVNPSVTPSVSINNNQSSLCSGQSFVFSANPTNGGGSPSYQWTLNGNVVNNTGTYSTGTLNVGDVVAVTLTSNATCASPTTATSSVTIVNCSAPLSVTASGGTTVCSGVSTVLTATGAGGTGSYTYTWQPGNLNGATVTVAPTSTTTYTVTINDGSNTATANAVVNVTPSVTPSVNISNNQANLCSGQSFTFTANPINGGTTPSYNWTLNSNTVSTSSSYTSGVLNAGDVVRVTLTSNATCASPTTANASVTIANCSGPLSVTATGGTDVCAGGSATLNAVGDGGSGNYTYTWMPGSLSGASVTVSPAVTTTYTVTVNDGNTSATATTTVTVNPLPTAFAGNDVTICNGGSANLTATGGAAYTWSPGTGLSCINCASPTASPTASTIYSVTVTDANGCTATDEVVVSVSTSALAEVSITADDDTLCAGSSYTFTASPVNGGTPSYQWTLNGNNVGSNSATLVLANLDTDDEVACVMTSSLGCVTNTTATSNTLTVIDCNVGILDIAKQSITINVMPNPSTGLFFVDLAEVKDNATVEVFNMQGQLVFTELTDKATLNIDIAKHGQGLYLMRVSTENGVATKKLIKE